MIGLVGVAPGPELAGERLLIFGDVLLGDHVLDCGLDLAGEDTVETAPHEPEEAVTFARNEGLVHVIGDLHGLTLYSQAADD